jgi:hypothetical protein
MEDFPEVKPDTEQLETDQSGGRKRKRRRGEDFLSAWLRRRMEEQAAEAEEHEDDEDDEEDDGKEIKGRHFSKRLRKALKSVFGRIAPITPVNKKEDADASQGPEQISTERLAASAASPAAGPASPEVPGPIAPRDASEAPVTANQQEEQTAASGQENDKNKPAGETKKEAKEEVAEKAAGQKSNGPDRDRPRSTIQNSDPGPPPIDIPAMERVVYERQVGEPERVAAHDKRARGLATLTGVGLVAETIGRRRAVGRLESAQNKDRAHFEKEIKQEQQQRAKLEHAASSAKHTSEQLQSRQTAFEAKPGPKPSGSPERGAAEHRTRLPAPEVPPPLLFGQYAAERPPAGVRENGRKEVLPNNSEERREPAVEKLLHSREALKQPERILQEVEAAAEKNIPLEKIYETRHEVKDQRGMPAVAAAAGAAPASATPQAVSADTSALLQQAGTSSAGSRILQEIAHHRQAARNGALWAVVIIIFLGIAMLVG